MNIIKTKDEILEEIWKENSAGNMPSGAVKQYMLHSNFLKAILDYEEAMSRMEKLQDTINYYALIEVEKVINEDS